MLEQNFSVVGNVIFLLGNLTLAFEQHWAKTVTSPEFKGQCHEIKVFVRLFQFQFRTVAFRYRTGYGIGIFFIPVPSWPDAGQSSIPAF